MNALALFLLVILSESCVSNGFVTFGVIRSTVARTRSRSCLSVAPQPKSQASKVARTSDEELDPQQFAKIQDEERLQKVIARAGISSRRDAEKMVGLQTRLYFVFLYLMLCVCIMDRYLMEE